MRIARGAGVKGVADFHGPRQDPTTRSVAVAHDLVFPADRDVDQRFDATEAKRLRAISESKATASVAHSGIEKKKKKKPYKRVKSATVQLGLTFVPLDNLRSHTWRGENMFDFPHSVLAARLINLLEGPKQQRATTM